MSAAPFLPPEIREDEEDHGLPHGHETRQKTGIVSAARADLGGLAGRRHGSLRLRQAARRLQGDPADDRFTAGDAAKHAAVAIGAGADAAILFADESIVVVAATSRGHTETGSIFKTHDRGE